MTRRKVFFDDAPLVMFPVILYYLLCGDEILIFDFSYKLKRSKWLARLFNSGRIKRIFLMPNSKEHGDAIDFTDAVFNKMKHNRLPQLLASVYADSETDLVFKKDLVNEIYKCICVNRYLAAMNASGAQRLFIQTTTWKYEQYLGQYCSGSLKELDNLSTPLWTYPFRLSAYYLIWTKYFMGTVFYVLMFIFMWLLGIIRRKKIAQKKARFIVPIENNFQMKFDGERKFDFLLDGGEININNTLFLVHQFAAEKWVNEQSAKGYQLIRAGELYRFTNLIGSNCELMRIGIALRLLLDLIFHAKAPSTYLSAFLKGLVAYTRCCIIFNRFSFKSYVYTNNESTVQIATNILFKKKEVLSLCYLSFLVGGYPRSKDHLDFVNNRNTLWAYLNPDYLVAMNEDVVSYFKLHKQCIKNYRVLGSLYSEMVRCNSTKIDKKFFIKEHFPKQADDSEKKICAFFDTTFVDENIAFADFSDCVSFYSDILRLLDNRDDLLIIIKPSKNESFYTSPSAQWSSPEEGEKISNIMKQLRCHPDVFFAGDTGDIPAIMAVSDLVVTHCMSSTTAEALGAKKRSFWYESGNKHKDLLYDHISGLIMHGFSELESRLDSLLYQTSEQEYEEYLEKHIKGKIESHLDGLALTRFRKLLIAKTL